MSPIAHRIPNHAPTMRHEEALMVLTAAAKLADLQARELSSGSKPETRDQDARRVLVLEARKSNLLESIATLQGEL